MVIMRNYEHRRSKLINLIKKAKKEGKKSINLKILSHTDIRFLIDKGHNVRYTSKKYWYEVFL